ncbi:MAG: ABC transporter ATP-binding protein [bacterium]|nr:ABC transporter ATP-binding protein [bacterium]
MEIKITGLTKIYKKGAPPALKDVNLTIQHGTFGLLGPNGAGKTTLIKILSTQMEPSAGQVKMDDWDLSKDRSEIRRRIGYLPQHFGTYPTLTGWEFMDYMARLAGIHNTKIRKERVSETLNDVGLYEDRDRRSGTFSGGMMRRLGIAQAIVGDPEFLIVDEPTVGLDPEERIRFRGILGRLGRDRAILISTHIVGDISSTCEVVAVLDSGRLLYRGSPEEFIHQADGKTWQVRVDDKGFEAMAEQYKVVTIAVDGDLMDLRMVGEGTPPGDAKPVPPNLEDAYVHFMDEENLTPELSEA